MEQHSGETGITGGPVVNNYSQVLPIPTLVLFCNLFRSIVVAVYCCSCCVLRLAMLHFSYSTSGTKRTHQSM